MKPQEIRIGNLVFRNGGMFTCNRHSIPDCHFYPEYYKAIPLTEEWLLKFGFVADSFDSNRWNYKSRKSQFHICLSKEQYVFRGVGMSVVIVSTVHHLQNIIYVLTGEELILKPRKQNNI